MAEQVTGCVRCGRRFARRDFGEAVYLFERPVESIENSLEFDTHLQGKCPAGIIIRRDGRSSGVTEIVRMILWLEHIEDVRSKCLSSFHYIRTGWIVFSVDLESAFCGVDTHAGLDQSIDEFGCSRKVRLIGRQDISARIAFFGSSHRLIKLNRLAALDASGRFLSQRLIGSLLLAVAALFIE